jgi:hypothetical protein
VLIVNRRVPVVFELVLIDARMHSPSAIFWNSVVADFVSVRLRRNYGDSALN